MIDRYLLVVDSQTCTMGIGIRKEASEKHLVRAGTYSRHHVVRLESGLLNLCVEICRVAVKLSVDQPLSADNHDEAKP